MKNALIFGTFLLIFILFSCFPDSEVIYASKYAYNSSYSVRPSDTLSPISDDGPRDFKIPDESDSENTPYDIKDKPGNQAMDNSSDIISKPWRGTGLVVIDPGHGGKDPGANIGGLFEKAITLDISKRLTLILNKLGVTTYMTRTDDTYISTRQRIDTANKKKAVLFISIHSNWFRDASLNGTMTLYCPSNKLAAGNLTESDYARTVQQKLASGLDIRDRGIIDRPNLTVLKHANMPSVLVEIGFLSNKSDAERLSSDEFRQKTAEALANGIKQALEKIPVK